MAPFDLPGALRRIRRQADLSQRELATRLGVSKSTIAAAETGDRGMESRMLARAAECARLRLALLDEEGREALPMADDAARDMGYRRFPAHLDTRHSDQGWWHGPERYSRRQPWYTFDRDRRARDGRRRDFGTPEDHQVPQPGDSPDDRREQRRAKARRRAAEELQRRFEAGELGHASEEFRCGCPPECEQLDEGLRPVHTPGCPCRCDIG